MKKRKQNFQKKIQFIAGAILAIITVLCFVVNPAVGASICGAGSLAIVLPSGLKLEGDSEKLYTALLEGIQKEVEKYSNSYISSEDAKKTINDNLKNYLETAGLKSDDFANVKKDLAAIGVTLKDINLKEIAEAVKSQGLLIKGMQENGIKGENKFTEGIKSLIKNFKENIKGTQSEKFGEVEIEMKAPATTITTANVDVTSIPYIPSIEVMSGVVQDVKPVQTIMNLITVQPISKSSLAWTERKTPNGNATWIGEGELKVLQDYTWETYTEATKKIASRTKFSEEAIDDIDFMQGEIYALQGRDLERQTATAILSATKSSTSIGGIITMASAYTITALNDTVLKPNLYEVCNAMNAQCTALGFVGRKSLVVNTFDWAIAKGEKDKDYRNLDVAKRIMDEYTVVEDPEIPAGYVLFGELSYFTARIYKQKGIRLGYSSEDWEHDLMSAIAENRLLTMLPDNHKGAIIYDAIGTIKAAIELEEPVA